MGKIVSQLGADGYFVGPVVADESPLEPGVFLIPAGAVDRVPPTVEPGKRYRVWGASWRGEALPAPDPLPPGPSAADIRRVEIVGRLDAIDRESVRALREVSIARNKGASVPAFAAGKLDALEADAAALRIELAGL